MNKFDLQPKQCTTCGRTRSYNNLGSWHCARVECALRKYERDDAPLPTVEDENAGWVDKLDWAWEGKA
jgi:hypothetical protein